jgi:SIR2-like domain
MLSTTDAKTLTRNMDLNRVVLFAGAGFSVDARNLLNETIPLGSSLAQRLWSFLYETPYDDKTPLKTLYEASRTHKKGRAAVRDFLRSQLHVVEFPAWYQLIPRWYWFRIYTTNADDLMESVYDSVRTPGLDKIVAPGHFQERDAFLRRIQFVKLHGCVNDDTKDLTFSHSEYGNRASLLDVWYIHFVEDYSTLNTVFVGTQLDEPLFWQYIEIRRQRERDAPERRPKSFLVSPNISKPMETVLDTYNIVPIRATGKQFFEWLEGNSPPHTREAMLRVLDPSLEPALLAAEEGTPQRDVALAEYFYSFFKTPLLAPRRGRRSLFLLGSPPTWEDIAAGIDAHREVSDGIRSKLEAALENGEPDLFVISASAGSGKSTLAKRAAAQLIADGHTVFYSEGDSRPDPDRLAQYVKMLDRRVLLVFDHAGWDLREIGEFYERTKNLPHKPVIMVVARSNDFLRFKHFLAKARIERIRVPLLTESDITSLLGVLETNRLLGELLAMRPEERVEVFRTKAHKQILVAMREATTGRGFDNIITDEFASVEPLAAKLLYLVAAIPSIENYGLSLAQMVTAMGLPPNDTLRLAEDSLADILVQKEGELGRFVIRHPIIARFVVESVAPRELLAEATIAFLRTVFTALPPPGRARRASRAFGVYRFTINHRRMRSLFPAKYDLVIHIYEEIKDLFSDEGHYWLQYGSYELLVGDALDKAENYINQAAAIMPDSVQVTTAMAHLLLRKAMVAQTLASAESLMQEASRTLRAQMSDNRVQGLHCYHIFGSQMMSYIRIWVPENERAEKYNQLHTELRRSIPVHLRTEQDLRQLLDAIKRAELDTAIP